MPDRWGRTIILVQVIVVTIEGELSLFKYLAKVYERILEKRLAVEIELQLGKEQYG